MTGSGRSGGGCSAEHTSTCQTKAAWATTKAAPRGFGSRKWIEAWSIRGLIEGAFIDEAEKEQLNERVAILETSTLLVPQASRLSNAVQTDAPEILKPGYVVKKKRLPEERNPIFVSLKMTRRSTHAVHLAASSYIATFPTYKCASFLQPHLIYRDSDH